MLFGRKSIVRTGRRVRGVEKSTALNLYCIGRKSGGVGCWRIGELNYAPTLTVPLLNPKLLELGFRTRTLEGRLNHGTPLIPPSSLSRSNSQKYTKFALSIVLFSQNSPNFPAAERSLPTQSFPPIKKQGLFRIGPGLWRDTRDLSANDNAWRGLGKTSGLRSFILGKASSSRNYMLGRIYTLGKTDANAVSRYGDYPYFCLDQHSVYSSNQHLLAPVLPFLVLVPTV